MQIMDKDEIIKSLNDQVTLLQSKVKSYARLGELYENSQAELNQLRVNQHTFDRAYGSEDNVSLSHKRDATDQRANVDIVKKSSNSEANSGGISRSASLPVSGPGPPPLDSVYGLCNSDTTVSVSRPPLSSLTLTQSVHQPPILDAALITDNNCDDSMTLPTLQNNDNDSYVQPNVVSLVAADKTGDASCDLAGQSSFTGKLADLVAEGKRLEQLVAKITTELEGKDQRIDNLTQELQQAKEQLNKVQGQGQRGVASEWVVLGAADKVQQRDVTVTERSPEVRTEQDVMRERKIVELSNTVKELKAANKCWEQHLKQVNKDNTARHEALESECRTLRQQLVDTGTLRHDCDEAVTTARRLAEDAEKDRQRAVAEAGELKRRCDQLEASLALVHQREREKKTGAERRCREMENIIQGQKEYINKLEHQLMNQSTMTVSTPPVIVPSHNTTDLSLPTEVMLLHQQVALWKEDFEKERADREKAKSELDTVRKVSLEDRTLLHKERDTCRQLKDKLEQAEREKRDLQAKLIEKAAELLRVKKEAHKPSYSSAKPAAEGPKPWNCTKCTFVNSPSDRYCAMCGNISWLQVSATPSAPPRDRHLLHHNMEGPDVCDGDHMYDDQPPRYNLYNQQY